MNLETTLNNLFAMKNNFLNLLLNEGLWLKWKSEGTKCQVPHHNYPLNPTKSSVDDILFNLIHLPIWTQRKMNSNNWLALTKDNGVERDA